MVVINKKILILLSKGSCHEVTEGLNKPLSKGRGVWERVRVRGEKYYN